MLENKIEKKACALVWKYLGIKGSKLNIIGDTGYPDRIFWVPGGKPLMIEFKAPGEKSRPKQRQIHRFLKSLGYLVEVHDNAVNAFSAVVDSVDPSRLSEEGFEIYVRARRECAVLGSGSGKDSNYARSHQISEEQESAKESFISGATEAMLRGVAGRSKKVEGL